MKRILLFFAASSAAFFAPALRGDVESDLVPADAVWAANLDFVALRDSELGQRLIAMVPAVETDLGAGFSVDIPRLLTMIGNVTAFGEMVADDPMETEGAVVIRGTEDLRTIARGIISQRLLSEDPAVEELTNFSCEAYRIDGKWIVAFPDEPVLLGATSREEMMRALAVFRGEVPSVATGRGPLAEKLTALAGSFISVAAVVPESLPWADEDRIETRILTMVQFLSLALAERGEETTASIFLEARSDDSAVTVQKVLEGAVSLAALLEAGDEQLREFVNAAEVRREGKDVRLRLGYSTQRLLTMIEAFRGQPRELQSQPPSLVLDPPGKVLAEWIADAHLGDAAPGAGNFVTQVIENVHLVPGSTLVISGARHDGEHARLDYLEITPTGAGGEKQRFEAEYMRLNRYRIEHVPLASDGEVIMLQEGHGDARLRFSGAEGTYTLAARYVDESDGQAPFVLSLVEP